MNRRIKLRKLNKRSKKDEKKKNRKINWNARLIDRRTFIFFENGHLFLKNSWYDSNLVMTLIRIFFSKLKFHKLQDKKKG